MSKPLKVFITYSHEDDQKRKKLRTHLAVMEKEDEIKLWDDTGITAGGDARQQAILKEVAGSDTLLYLVSADSLASENCNKELTEAGNAKRKVIPIILESCDWQNHQIRYNQALPDKGRPINEWQPESKGWQNVVDGIRNAVKEIPSQAELALQHGNSFITIKQLDMAIERYSHAIELDPNFAAAYINRGLAYEEKKDYDSAIADHNKAIELKPDYAYAYAMRGLAYNSKGEYDNAIRDFSRAIELSPDYVYAYAYVMRGSTYVIIKEYNNAFWDFNRAIQLNPNCADAYAMRGFTYNIKGEYNNALCDFNRAIQLDSNNDGTYYGRGIAWLHLRECEHARVDLTTAKNMGMDIITTFHEDHGSVSAFEQKYRVKLPPDITALLTPP